MFYLFIDHSEMYSPYLIIGREPFKREMQPGRYRSLFRIDDQKVEELIVYADGKIDWRPVEEGVLADSANCTKLCPKCKATMPYFEYTCPSCGYVWP